MRSSVVVALAELLNEMLLASAERCAMVEHALLHGHVTFTEAQTIAETSGPNMPYDRCQWCRCTLKSGYHGDECPVREEQERER